MVATIDGQGVRYIFRVDGSPPPPPWLQKVTFEYTTVTPEMARDWLERVHPNRNTTHNRKARIINALQNKRYFGKNAELLRFNADGVLIDGKHRLEAIVDSGIAMDTFIVRGLPREAFDTIDTGRPRTAADMLYTLGHLNTTATAAGLRHIQILDMLMVTGSYYSAKNIQQAETEIVPWRAREMIGQWPDLPEWIARSRKLRQAGVPGGEGFWAGLLAWLAVRLPDANDDVEAFAQHLMDGAGLEEGDPILALRNRVMAERGTTGRVDNIQIMAWTIKAWNAYRRGENVRFLKWIRGGANKEKFPLPI